MALPFNELQAAVAEAESNLKAAQQSLTGTRFGTTAHTNANRAVQAATTQLVRAQQGLSSFVDPAVAAQQAAPQVAEIARLKGLKAGTPEAAAEAATFQKAEAGAQAARVQAGELSVMEQARVDALQRTRGMTYDQAVRTVRGVEAAEAAAKPPKVAAPDVPVDPDTGKAYKGAGEATKSTPKALKAAGLDPKLGEVSKRTLSATEIAQASIADETRIADQLQRTPKGLEPGTPVKGANRVPYVTKAERAYSGPERMKSTSAWLQAERSRAMHLITDPNSEFYGQQIDDVVAQMKQRRTPQGLGGTSRTGVLRHVQPGQELPPRQDVTRALTAQNEALRARTRGVPQADPMARPQALRGQGLGPEALGRGRSAGLMPGTPMPTQGRAPIPPGGSPTGAGGRPIPPPGRVMGTYQWPAGTPQPPFAGGGGALGPAQDARLAAQLGETPRGVPPMGRPLGQQRIPGMDPFLSPRPQGGLAPPAPPNPALPSSQIPGQQSLVSGMGKPLGGFQHPAAPYRPPPADPNAIALGRAGSSAPASTPAGYAGAGYGGRTPKGFELATRGEMGMVAQGGPQVGTHTTQQAEAAWNAQDSAGGKGAKGAKGARGSFFNKQWGAGGVAEGQAAWLGGLKNRALRNPAKIFGNVMGAEAGVMGKGAAAVGGKAAVPAGAIGKYAAARGAFAGLNAIGPTWLVGSLTSGVNQIHPEGSFADQVVEGAQIGTSIGASFGPWGMAVGATAGVSLNVLTGGLLGNVIQALPIVGGAFFGGSEGPTDEEKLRETALAAYTAAATNQGYMSKSGEDGSKPNAAAAATDTLLGLSAMQQAGLMPATADIFMIAGRMSGFEGFPWEAEAAEPVYSADDINKISQGMEQYLQPEQFVLDIVANTNFDHIKDDEARGSLEQWKAWTLSSLSTGLAATAMQPLTTAMTASYGLQGQQQAGLDQEWAAGPGAAASFEDLLASNL